MTTDVGSDKVWFDVGFIDDLAIGSMMKIDVAPPVAVYHLEDGVFATADTCTHMHSSLCDGYLEGDVIECELHMATFAIRSGEALTLPATVPLRTFPVKVEDGRISVCLDADMLVGTGGSGGAA